MFRTSTPPPARPALSKAEQQTRRSQLGGAWVVFALLVPMAVFMVALGQSKAVEKRQRLDVLRAALADEAPAMPAPSRAGQVVHVRGIATTAQVTHDAEHEVTLRDMLLTRRLVERWQRQRTGSWKTLQSVNFVATDARLGSWEMDASLLALADPEHALTPLAAGRDHAVPKGWVLYGDGPAEFTHRLVDAGERGGPSLGTRTGDLRLSYRALPAGPLSIVAMVDGSGRRLVPLDVDGVPLAVVRPGEAEPAALFRAETATIDADLPGLFVVGLVLTWLGFAAVHLCLRRAHWMSSLTVRAIPMAVLVTAAAATGTLAAGLLAGIAVAGLMVALMVRPPRRLGGFTRLETSDAAGRRRSP